MDSLKIGYEAKTLLSIVQVDWLICTDTFYWRASSTLTHLTL
jgi:hypothetical protein